MSKRFRVILVILVLVVGGAFLYPTVKWYFWLPQEKRELASGTREQIRLYAQNLARGDLEKFKALQPDDPIPREFSYLINTAKSNYRLFDRKLPSAWTAKTVRDSFTGQNLREVEQKLFTAFEDHYRTEILDLKELKSGILMLGLDLSGGMNVTLEANLPSLEKRLGHAPSQAERDEAIDRALEILTNRIDTFGVTEPEIRRQGDTRISVEIPGDPDPERVNAFLMGKGSLTFHIVDDEATQKLIEYQAENPGYNPASTPDLDFIPAGDIVLGYYTKDNYNIDQLVRYIVLKEEVALDGNLLTSAVVGRHPVTGRPTVNFALSPEGGDIFFQVTSTNVNKSLAVVMDDKVKSYAVIQEAIRDNVQISGLDQDEANNLALTLRTAALPVDLDIINQSQVGATLGADAIQEGLRSILIGFLLVVVFLLFYYKGAGVIADIALFLNLFLLVAILSAFNFTLTLTSIAGLILTVGMADDANIIIYERMKEEYRLGKSPQACVKAGFHKAFSAILDSNVTTLIAAVFLAFIGSGPVQGFAVTLAVGIGTTLFTGLFVSRLMFDFSTDVFKARKLSLGWGLK